MLNTVNMNLIISTLHVFEGHLEKCWCLGTEFYTVYLETTQTPVFLALFSHCQYLITFSYPFP